MSFVKYSHITGLQYKVVIYSCSCSLQCSYFTTLAEK